MRACAKRPPNQRGVVLLMAAGVIFVLLAFLGLSFDVGYLDWQRRRAQTAADGAAMAGAWALQRGGDLVTKGREGAALNFFTNGTDGVTVDLHNPPLQGAYAGNNRYVEAVVSQDAPSF